MLKNYYLLSNINFEKDKIIYNLYIFFNVINLYTYFICITL